MRDDPELGFSGRHPTDLRDRFRIKYPDKYVKAGNKLKAKEEQHIIEQPTHGHDNQQKATQMLNAQPQTQQPHPQRANPTTSWPMEKNVDSNDPSSFHLPNDSNLKVFAHTSSYFSSTDLDNTSSFFEEHADTDDLPITLNRDILRWANTNPSSLFAMAPPPLANVNHATAAEATGRAQNHALPGNSGVLPEVWGRDGHEMRKY
jgi:hypothetical protein